MAWVTPANELRGAFSLMPTIDNEINIDPINSVKPEDNKNILQKIFSKDKKKMVNKK